jgi:signal transduction histidine kinase
MNGDNHQPSPDKPRGASVLEHLLAVCEHDVRQQADKLKDALEEARARARQIEDSEDALRRQKRILESVLESIGEGVIVADTDGNFLIFNAAAERLVGIGLLKIPPSQWTEQYGCFLPDMVTPYPAEQLPLARAMRGEYVEENEVFIRNPQRPRGLWLGVNAAPWLDGAGAILGGVVAFRDVTARKLAEQNLKSTAEELARSNVDLEQFAYVVSHDLQEPLRMVSSFCQLLQQRYQGKLDKNADDFLGFAVDGARRMERLINDLLAYSRAGSRGQKLAATNLSSVFDQAIANLATAIGETSAVITRGELPTVQADAVGMGQLAQNLLSNAIKFHGPRTPRIHVQGASQGQSWLVTVKDNGIGIAATDVERIFGVFERSQSPSSAHAGTGIGLAICKRIVERHGGRIWVESKVSEGSVFSFTIPNEGIRP